MTSDAHPNSSGISLRADTVATRLRILRAAEQLFSEGGIDAVSLQQVGREAGQRNRSAVQYHFGDKKGVLIAILNRHTPSINEHRNELIDQIEEDEASSDLRRLAEAFVLPVVRKAQDPDGGMAHVRISAQLIGHPDYTLYRLEGTHGRVGSRRLSRLVAAAGADIPTDYVLPRLITMTGLVFHGLSDWSRIAEERDGTIGERAWSVMTEHLVELVAAHVAINPGSARS